MSVFLPDVKHQPHPPHVGHAKDRRTRVDHFAGHHVYCFAYQVAQDVSAYLVLSPPRTTCPGMGSQQAGP